MVYIKRLYDWVSIPWPLHLVPVFIGGHFILLSLFPENSSNINLYCSSGFPFIGGLFVIITINSKLNILSRSSINNSIIGWFKAFPGKAKSYTFVGDMSMNLSVNGKARLTPKMESIEEKIEYLFEETKRLEKESCELKIELKTEIHKVEERLLPRINNLSDEAKEIKTKMNNVLVGGARLEILGILIILYGLAIPFIWNA